MPQLLKSDVSWVTWKNLNPSSNLFSTSSTATIPGATPFRIHKFADLGDGVLERRGLPLGEDAEGKRKVFGPIMTASIPGTTGTSSIWSTACWVSIWMQRSISSFAVFA